MTNLPQTHRWTDTPEPCWYHFTVWYLPNLAVTLCAGSPAEALAKARRAFPTDLPPYRMTSPVHGMYAPPLMRPDPTRTPGL